MFNKRNEIYKMHKAFKCGMMQPNIKRGGAVEVAYVNRANKEILSQVDVKSNLFNCMEMVSVLFQVLTIESGIVVGLLCHLVFYYEELKDYKLSVSQNFTVGTETSPLPFIMSYIPFDHENGIGYWMAAMFQMYSTFLYGQYICAMDAIICGLIIQVKAQLLILQNYIGLFLAKCEEKFVRVNNIVLAFFEIAL